MGKFEEFECTLIKDRQMEGITLAKEFGISRENIYKHLRGGV